VARWLSVYGLAAMALGLVGASVELLGNNAGMLSFIALLPFELITGFVLMLRGASEPSASAA
jgi:hypothetical protein